MCSGHCRTHSENTMAPTFSSYSSPGDSSFPKTTEKHLRPPREESRLDLKEAKELQSTGVGVTTGYFRNQFHITVLKNYIFNNLIRIPSIRTASRKLDTHL